MSEGVRVREREADEVRCAFCREPAKTEARRCPACATILHQACWQELGTCPSLGCERAAEKAAGPSAFADFRQALRREGLLEEPVEEKPHYPPWAVRSAAAAAVFWAVYAVFAELVVEGLAIAIACFLTLIVALLYIRWLRS